MADILTIASGILLQCSPNDPQCPAADSGISADMITAYVICFSGVAILSAWLLRTSMGTEAFINTRARRHCMRPSDAFAPLIAWFLGINSSVLIANWLAGGFSDQQILLMDNTIFVTGSILAVILLLLFARKVFARGLKGFGLDIRTIPRDIPAAFMNLLAVWPLVFIAVVLVDFAGRKYYGPQFEIQSHDALKALADNSYLPLKILISVLAVIMAPVLEEIIYRGFIQTMLRSVTQKPWLAVIFTSAIFTFSHLNAMHWPMLFILGMCLGYAYEKSGSLLRSIFIHMLFNAASTITVLLQ